MFTQVSLVITKKSKLLNNISIEGFIIFGLICFNFLLEVVEVKMSVRKPAE